MAEGLMAEGEPDEALGLERLVYPNRPSQDNGV